MKKSNKKKILIAALFAVLAIGASVAWRGCSANTEPQQAPEQTQAQEEQTTIQEASDGTNTRTDNLNQRQQELTARYTEGEKEAAALLAANVWAAGSSSATLRFTDNSFIETREGAPDVEKSFAIAAYKLENSAIDANGEYTTTYTLALDTGDQQYICTLSQLHPATNADQPWTVKCEAFAYSAIYTRIDQAIDLTLDGINDNLTDLVGGVENIGKLHALIKGYCSQYHPSATIATWDKKIAIDYAQNTAVITFALNNAAKTNLKALHVLGSDAFEIGK